MTNGRSPDADFFANIQTDSPRPSRAKGQKKEKSGVRIVRKFKLPFNLLPLSPLERNIYAGVAAISIWYLLTNWSFSFYNFWWGNSLIDYTCGIILSGLSDFFRGSEADSLGAGVMSVLELLFRQVLPPILGILVAGTAALLVLKSLGVIALKVKLVYVAPLLLTIILCIIVYATVIAPPLSAFLDALFPAYRKSRFEFDFMWGYWIEQIAFTMGQLVVVAAAAVLAWVPALAPEKD
jgi:hypothetical protein